MSMHETMSNDDRASRLIKQQKLAAERRPKSVQWPTIQTASRTVYEGEFSTILSGDYDHWAHDDDRPY
jgi:hypothetical protein